ncbi:SDR family oxidoreductase [Pseudogracilibacillus sp. SO30301A]|uniref:SDR family oxidoreductase n=1 Tax=Pseudogracilibacillus sp. SO30301A TaxID=3098291 RepID=UPI00300E61E8
MDLLLKGKTVIVTGASQGLGKAIAMEYAAEGAHVYISSRSEEKLQAAVEEIRNKTRNNEVNYTVCDMKNDAQIQTLVQKVVEKYGTVDVLVNNAGGPPAGKFMDMSDDEWFNAFEQNLLSVVRATKKVIPYMKQQEAGRIVTITSSSIKQSIDNLILSNTMRPGVFGLTKSLSQEFAAENILVNTVGPGKIATDRMMQLNETTAKLEGISLEEVEKASVADIPMGRYGRPDEFAKTVVFLGSFANTYVTGQAVIVDGASVKAL